MSNDSTPDPRTDDIVEDAIELADEEQETTTDEEQAVPPEQDEP